MQSTASHKGLPVSRVINVASACSRARILPPSSRSNFAFSTPGTFHQACCAAFAAATARSTSADPQSGTLPRTSSVAGLMMSRPAFVSASTQAPLIRILCMPNYDAEWAMSATPDTALLVWLTPSLIALFLYGIGQGLVKKYIGEVPPARFCLYFVLA